MFRYFWIVFVPFVILSCSPYKNFDRYFSNSDFLSAYQSLQKIQQKQSVEYQKRLYQSIIFLSLNGDSDFEQKLFDKVQQNETNQKILPYQLFGKAFLRLKKAKSSDDYLYALAIYTNISSPPEELLPYYQKQVGICYYKTGQFEKAVSNLSLSLKKVKMQDSAYFLALSLIEMSNLKEAREILNQIILESKDPFLIGMASFHIGEIDYEEGNYRSAFRHYIDGINRYPDTAYYHLKAAKCLKKLGYPETFPKFANIALRIQKDFADAWYFLNVN